LTPPALTIGGNTSCARYLVQGSGGAVTHDDAIKIAQDAETAGVVPAEFAAKVASGPAPIPQAQLEAAKAFASGKQLADVGLDPATVSNPATGSPYSPEVRKAVAVNSYVAATQNLLKTTANPAVVAAINSISLEPTLAGKAAIAAKYQDYPVVKTMLDANGWLLKTGQR
jgi:hypothetical protein